MLKIRNDAAAGFMFILCKSYLETRFVGNNQLKSKAAAIKELMADDFSHFQPFNV